MKAAYNLVAISALFAISVLTANAQSTVGNDTTLNRQIYLERNFDPTLQDAAKINSLPVVRPPEAKSVNLRYEEQQPSLVFGSFPLVDTGSGSIRTVPGFDRHKGYLSFGIGNYTNIAATAGYRAVDTQRDVFDIMLRHYSTNGKIDYLNPNFKNTKAKYSNTLVDLNYRHAFSSSAFQLSGGYENTGFNYYGMPFEITDASGNLLPISSRNQSVGVFSLGTGLKSTTGDIMMRYDIALDFDHFSTKYNPAPSIKNGVSGNILNGKLHLAAPFQGNKRIGVRFGVLNQSFGNLDGMPDEDVFHSLTKINALAYFGIDGDNYNLSLGATVDYAMDKENKFLMSPDLHFSWQFVEKATFYTDVTGRINENTYLQILQENRYFNPESRLAYSRTPIDAKAGFRSGVIKGFEFDISGGYKLTWDEHLYLSHFLSDSRFFVLDAEYVDLGTTYFSGLLKTTLIPYTDLSAKLTGYFYSVDSEIEEGDALKPWNLPSMTMDVNADVRLSEKMTLSANYKLVTGREVPFAKMKDISELNLGGTYRFTDNFSAFLQLNNLLFQKYETWYGYTHQGFNAMAGVKAEF